MKARSLVKTLLAATTIAYSLAASAEICYDVSGSLSSKNITPSLQMGNMDFTLHQNDQVVFSESGTLVGNIASSSAEYGMTILDHDGKFPQGNKFKTRGDVARIVGIAGAESDGTLCAFFIEELISDMPKGTGIFKQVTAVEIMAEGTVSNCSYHNENVFTLSGQLCVE